MKHSLLTCFLLMTAVTLQIAAAQDTINQSSQVNFSPYAEWESADSAIARQNAYSAYLQSLCPPDTVYIVLITPVGLYFWLRVDPMVDKYLNASPYAYCNGNPLKYIDPDGREITITGEDGRTITYVPGKQYDGNDSFTKEMWSQLDEISSTQSGGIVINELVNDDGKAFNITSQIAKGPNGLNVRCYTNGKRLFKMGGEFIGSEYFAHELFHAYQDLHGYGGASCANDVESYIFQGLVSSELQKIPFEISIPPQLMPNYTAGGTQYESAYIGLGEGRHDTNLLNALAIGFKQHSYAASMGITEKYTIFSKNQQYRILLFWRP